MRIKIFNSKTNVTAVDALRGRTESMVVFGGLLLDRSATFDFEVQLVFPLLVLPPQACLSFCFLTL